MKYLSNKYDNLPTLLHYTLYFFWLLWWTIRFKPRFIYASDILSTPIAYILSFFSSVQVIYHEHDTPLPKKQSRFFVQYCHFFRYRLARRAFLCLIPNQTRTEIFRAEMGGITNIRTVWNTPSISEVVNQKDLHSNSNKTDFWIIFHGSIGPVQVSSSLLKALTSLPETVKLRIVGYETIGHTGYKNYLYNIACELGIVHRIEILDSLPRFQLLKVTQMNDLGLVLFPMKSENINIRYMVGASNKPFDYLACGLPMLTSNLQDWNEMYVDPGYGLACDSDDPQSIAAAIEWCLNHREEMIEMGKRGRHRIINDWNYEKQFDPVLELVENSYLRFNTEYI